MWSKSNELFRSLFPAIESWIVIRFLHRVTESRVTRSICSAGLWPRLLPVGRLRQRQLPPSRPVQAQDPARPLQPRSQSRCQNSFNARKLNGVIFLRISKMNGRNWTRNTAANSSSPPKESPLLTSARNRKLRGGSLRRMPSRRDSFSYEDRIRNGRPSPDSKNSNRAYGPAKAIIDGRPYKKPEDIMKVKGIKEGEFSKIKDMITVE